ncbi:Glucosamine-phosphate N-acetyltransferase-like protein [Naganishia albida]|nr:Glucosamine-phosphate N-acetyltransferase-like protein [Naganishia albida]
MAAHFNHAGIPLLFDPLLIPVSADLGIKEDELNSIIARPLTRDDHSTGHLAVLAGLTVAPELTPATYQARFDAMLACPGTYFILVFEHVPARRIIATATLFVERKFLRNAGLVGHIEDVSVDPAMRGKNLGRRVIVALTEIAEKVGCYKTILDCNQDNIAFYEKCGFTHKEFEMVKYAGA